MTPQPATITLFNGIIELRPRSADKKRSNLSFDLTCWSSEKNNNIQNKT